MSFLVRKKHSSNNNSEDGHYYISISDLMTSLLFIFILILADMMLEFTKKKVELSQEIKKLEQNIEARKDLLQLLKDELSKQQITVDIDKENGNIRLKSDLLFERGSSEISKEGKFQIGEIAKILVEKMKADKFRSSIDTIFIEGHTDNTPINSNRFGRNWSNKELSSQRAINTYIEMDLSTKNEVSMLKSKKGKSLFSYSGYAETRPLCIEDIDECRNKNRRIEFYFTVNTPEIAGIRSKSSLK